MVNSPVFQAGLGEVGLGWTFKFPRLRHSCVHFGIWWLAVSNHLKHMFVQMWIFQTFWLEHQQHSWNHYLAILPCEAVISENQRSGGLVGQFWIMTSLLFEFSHMKTLKVIKHQHPNSNASGLRHFTKTFSNWFMNMFSSLTGTINDDFENSLHLWNSCSSSIGIV